MSISNVSTRRSFNTFDVQPSAPPPAGVIDFDELIIDWGAVPLGCVANIYWPSVNAAQVLKLADSRYASHSLGMADAHTVQCQTTRRLSYVPIPANAGPKFAGLISVELPASIAVGQTYTVTVRRVTTYTPPPPYIPPQPKSPAVNAHAKAASPTATGSEGGSSGSPTDRNVTTTSWRTLSGAFQINIPVQPAAEIQPFAENTLAVFKWRLSVMRADNRWRPVIIRYIDYLSQQIDANGGDASAIAPSQTGLPGKPRPGSGGKTGGFGDCRGMLRPDECLCIEGKIRAVVYDCFGNFEGFSIACCETETCIKASERSIEDIVLRACKERCRVEVLVCRTSGKLIKLVVLG